MDAIKSYFIIKRITCNLRRSYAENGNGVQQFLVCSMFDLWLTSVGDCGREDRLSVCGMFDSCK